jgi:choline kinase
MLTQCYVGDNLIVTDFQFMLFLKKYRFNIHIINTLLNDKKNNYFSFLFNPY